MMNKSKKPNNHAVIKMAIAMMIFGSVGFFSERTGVPALELVFIRCLCASLFLSVLWIITGSIKKEVWDKREVGQIFFCGIFLVLNWVYFFKSIEASGVTVAISIYHLAPVIVMIFGAFIYKERLNVLAVLAIIVCFVGILFIAEVNKNVRWDLLLTSGMTWGLLSALFYALLTLTGKGIRKTSVYAITILQVSLGVVLLFPLSDFSHFADLNSGHWINIFITGFLHTGIVFYLFFDSIRFLSTQLISILVFLDPVVAILMDVFITGFIPSFPQWIGIFLIFAGMTLTLRRSRTKIDTEIS